MDGFEVDMSGFGCGESDGSAGSPSSASGRRKTSLPPLSLIGGGELPWNASMLSPPLGRGHRCVLRWERVSCQYDWGAIGLETPGSTTL